MATSETAPALFDASMRIVVLHGSDVYLRDTYTKRLVEVLEEAFGDVGQFRYDGSTAEPAVVLDELRSYGLLQTHKLVILDQADQFLAVRHDQDEDKAGRSRMHRELLERYATEPVDSATLLLRAEGWRRGRLDKLVARCGTIVKCETPNASRATRWLTDRAAAEHDCTVTPEAAGMLVDRIGPELARLDVELGKLAAYVGPKGTVGADEVRGLVGLSREEKAWEIQSALLSGSAATAITKLHELRTVSGQPEQLVIWSITDLARKLHAASRLLSRGAPGAAVARQLGLWGPAKDGVLRLAERTEPGRFAQLLRLSIGADLRNKSGIGNADRTLEALAARIADTLGCL